MGLLIILDTALVAFAPSGLLIIIDTAIIGEPIISGISVSLFVLELFLHCILYDLSDSTEISVVIGLEDKIE
jgi:hypothetical protein